MPSFTLLRESRTHPLNLHQNGGEVGATDSIESWFPYGIDLLAMLPRISGVFHSLVLDKHTNGALQDGNYIAVPQRA